MRALLALALLAAPAQAQPDWGTARDVEVRLSGFSYTPPVIALRSGEAVRLELVNDLTAARSFRAPRFFAAAEVAERDRPRVEGGAIRLAPGQRATVRLVAPTAGEYEVRSARVLQAALGLRGRIVVR